MGINMTNIYEWVNINPIAYFTLEKLVEVSRFDTIKYKKCFAKPNFANHVLANTIIIFISI